MKKVMVLFVLVVLLIMGLAISVGAMPDEGYAGRSDGYRTGLNSAEASILDCLARETGNNLPRAELKELRNELALNGNGQARPRAVLACTLPDQVSAR